MNQKPINIFVMTHCPFPCPQDPVYIPVQVGHALHDDLGYTGDDSGDNISVKNPYYSELTGLYWSARNVHDADYMGLCHYRRFFLSENGSLMTQQDFLDIFKTHDIILQKATRYPTSYQKVYEEAHNLRDLLLTGEAIQRLFPDYYPYFEEALASDLVYCGNLFVTDSARYKAYTDWLFTIFDDIEDQIDPEMYDDYHKRVFGFLSEQLLSVWVKKNGLSIYEANVGITQVKSETEALKSVLKGLVSTGTLEGVRQALEQFRSALRSRPDLLLPASDLDGELADMFRVLHVLELELESDAYKSNPKNCMFFVTTDLSLLVKHFRLITSILFHIEGNTASPEELAYYRDANVSESLLLTIAGIYPKLRTK